ncbi:hypothetical protein LJB42_000289 [Komagataella kurtzmanii]|nr:hypothetical protein LJB42_000289 [Komagataella kurtzmanii]
MAQEIVLTRFQPYRVPNLFQWSNDGDIAIINNNNNVVVLESTPVSLNPDIHKIHALTDLLVLKRNVLNPSPLLYLQRHQTYDDDVNITDTVMEPQPVSIRWSPKGFSQDQRSQLAVLYNNLQLYIFETDNWNCSLHVNSAIHQLDLEHVTRLPDIQRSRITGFSWAPLVDDVRLDDHHFMAISNGKGEIKLFELLSDKIDVKITVELPSIASTLEWSPWIQSQDRWVSYLTAITRDNSIHVIKVYLETDGRLISDGQLKQISKKYRGLHANSKWYNWDGKLIFFIVFTKSLKAFVFNSDQISHFELDLQSPLFFHDFELYRMDGLLRLILVESSGDYIRTEFSAVEGFANFEHLNFMVNEPTVEDPLYKQLYKIQKMLVKSADPQKLLIAGISMDPTSNVLGILYTKHKLASPVFAKSLAYWKVYFNIVPLRSVKTMELGKLVDYFSGSVINELLPLQYSGSLITQIISMYSLRNKNLYKEFESRIQNLTPFLKNKSNDKSLTTFSQHLRYHLFKDTYVQSLRFLNWFKMDKNNELIQIAARLIITFITDNKITLSNPVDEFILQSFNLISGLNLLPQKDNVVLHNFQHNIDESFDFTNHSSCSSLYSITSKEGHVWSRCAITLLPILSTNIIKDPISGLVALNDFSDYIQSEHECILVPILQQVCSVSLFTGGTFVS